MKFISHALVRPYWTAKVLERQEDTFSLPRWINLLPFACGAAVYIGQLPETPFRSAVHIVPEDRRTSADAGRTQLNQHGEVKRQRFRSSPWPGFAQDDAGCARKEKLQCLPKVTR